MKEAKEADEKRGETDKRKEESTERGETKTTGEVGEQGTRRGCMT